MKARYIILALFLIHFGEVTAALPPFYQDKREIETILSSPELNQYITSADQIVQIAKTPIGYMLITTKRVVAITVTYAQDKHIGPVRFTLEFHTLVEFTDPS